MNVVQYHDDLGVVAKGLKQQGCFVPDWRKGIVDEAGGVHGLARERETDVVGGSEDQRLE